MTQPVQDIMALWKVPSVLLIVAGHEGDSSVRQLTSEGMNTESAAELHLACFFGVWQLMWVQHQPRHVSDAVTVRYQ